MQIVIFILFLIIVGCSQQLSLEPEPIKTIPPSPKIRPKRDIKSANEYRQLGLDYRKQKNLVKAIQSLEKSVNRVMSPKIEIARGIKKITKTSLGYKSFQTAWRTIRGIEIMHAFNKGQVEGVSNRDGISQQQFVESLLAMAA